MRHRAALILAFLMLGAASAMGQVTTTYVGPNEGLWSDPANWDMGMVPDGIGFNAIIPNNRTVVFDLPDPTTINALQLLDSVDSRRAGNVRLPAGASLTTESITILGGGVFAADGGAFSSPPLFTTAGVYPRFYADAGGTIAAPLAAYNWNQGGHLDGRCNDTVIRADGLGSLVDLSSATSMRIQPGGCRDPQFMTVLARNDGVIDLSAVQSIRGRSDRTDWAIIQIETGGFIDLASLTSVSDSVRFDVRVSGYELPALDNVSRTDWRIRDGAAVEADALRSATRTRFELDDGGTFIAPNLTSIRESTLVLNPTRTFDAPPPTDFSQSTVRVLDGASFAIEATSYTAGNQVFECSGPVLYADGAGSRIDFSTCETVTVSPGGCGSGQNRSIEAHNGGVVDLSGTTLLRGRVDGQRPFILRTSTGGVIDLSALEETRGDIQFRPSTSPFELPALTTADRTGFYVETFNTINLPELTTMTRSSVNLEDGATLSSPNLTSFTESSVSLNPTRFWTTGELSSVDNSSFTVRGGARLDTITDDGYTANTETRDLFRAEGVGSSIDLSSLESVRVISGGGCAPCTASFVAADGGELNIPNATMFDGRTDRSDTRFRLLATTGGRINFGDADIGPGFLQLRGDELGSELAFSGSCRATRRVEIIVTDGATLSVGGDLSYQTQTASDFNLETGRLVMAGDGGTQALEVGSRDDGVPDPFAGGNFSIGSLRVGDTDRVTTVRLADAIDNGNRGSMDEPEALYLPGLLGVDALRIGPDSTLELGDVNLYVFDGAQWRDIRADIGTGGSIPWDEGRIVLGVCLPDLDGDGELTIFDFLAFQTAFDAGCP